MFSTKTAARILAPIALAILLAYSLRGPGMGSVSGLTVLMEPDGTNTWRDLIGRFNREFPGTPVRLTEGPASTDAREDMYTTSFLAGESSFDIVYMDVAWVAKFAAAGWLADLSERISDQDRAAFLPADLQGGTYEGKLYRMPALTDAGVLFYRRDLTPRPPETFDQLVALARGHQTADRWGYLWQGKQFEGLVTVFLEVLWGYGGDWIDAASREVLLDSPQSIQAIEFLKSAIGAISPVAVTNYAEEDTRAMFQDGRAVFLRNWPYVWTLAQRSGSGFQIAMAPPPHAPGGQSASTLGGWGFAISAFTADPDRAWRFVEWIARPAQLREIQQRQGRIPARRDMVPPEFLPIIEVARPRPAISEYAQASDILQRWLSAALTGRATPPEAVREAAAETRSLLAR